MVVDVDDDLAAIEPRNPAFTHYHPRLSPDRNWHHLARACAAADLVTVSTPALAERYGRHGRVCVLPNYVPARYLHVARPAAALTSPVLGWTGTPMTHRGDLAVAGDAVRRALQATGATFLAIGSEHTLTALGIPGEVAPWTPIDRYPEQVARLDVGIAPLELTKFTAAKSWLKPSEMAALGVAVVMSPTEEYLRLAALGVGEIARRPREWEGILRRLLTDHGWRRERAATGRAVMAGLTYEKFAGRWWDAWVSAARARRPACA